MPVIYIDVLFLTNLVMDCALLITTSELSGEKISPIRIVMGGVLGAGYGTAIFFLPISFLGSWIVRIPFSAVIILATFGFGLKKRFARLMINFFLSSFLLSGALSALFSMSGRPGIMSNGVYYFPLSIYGLILFSLPTVIIIGISFRKTKNRLSSLEKYCKVTIRLDQNELTAEGLIDTGSSLFDPYIKKPVIVIDRKMARKLLSPDFSGFRLLPYNTVDSGGIMKMFSPDLCLITLQDKTFTCSCSVAVSPQFSGGKIIINPEIFNNTEEINNEL